MRRFSLSAFLLVVSAHVFAQGTYPAKPIRVIVPFAAGTGPEQTVRIIGERFVQSTGQPLVIENKGGAGGNIGTDAVAKAAPDGYTLGLIAINMLVINPHLYRDMPYDPIRDFEPVAITIVQPLAVLAGPRLNVNTMQALISNAKANPGKLNFASSGNGSLQHIAGELLRNMAGLNIVHVPYKGAGPAMIDLLGGNVDFMITSLLGTTEYIKAGRLRLLATTGSRRCGGGSPP